MFTGIVACTGTLVERRTHGEDQTLTINAPNFDFGETQLGDSIAVNGVCLTAVSIEGQQFSADVSVETLTHTTIGHLTVGSRVNLEPALTLATPLGGHLVSGHVDGIGELIDLHSEARSERLTFCAPNGIARYIAQKGSITIDGISLTVNSVDGDAFSVNIVPHTLSRTTLGDYRSGQQVNLEVDLIARYVERLLSAQHQTTNLDITRLRELGY